MRERLHDEEKEVWETLEESTEQDKETEKEYYERKRREGQHLAVLSVCPIISLSLSSTTRRNNGTHIFHPKSYERSNNNAYYTFQKEKRNHTTVKLKTISCCCWFLLLRPQHFLLFTRLLSVVCVTDGDFDFSRDCFCCFRHQKYDQFLHVLDSNLMF